MGFRKKPSNNSIGQLPAPRPIPKIEARREKAAPGLQLAERDAHVLAIAAGTVIGDPKAGPELIELGLGRQEGGAVPLVLRERDDAPLAEPGGPLEGADAPFAQNDLAIAFSHDVFGRPEELIQGGSQAALEQDGPITATDFLEELEVLSGPQFGFVGPRYMTIDPDGLLIVADQDAHRVLKIDPFTQELLGTIGTGIPGKDPNLFDDPEGAAQRGSEFFFADSDNNRIVKYVVLLN